MDHRKILMIDWESMDGYASELNEKLKSWDITKEFTPDVIIGIARGGAVIATMLAYKRRVPMDIISASFRENIQTTSIHETLIKYKGKNVLIVDDIYDSGITLDTVIGEIAKYKGEINARTAVVITKDTGSHSVDLYGGAIPPNEYDWVAFPYEDDLEML